MATTSKKDQKEVLKKLKISVHNNLAAAHLKFKKGKARVALSNVKKVLELSPDDAKAKFREVQSYLKLNDLDRAREKINAELKKDPESSQYKKLKNTLAKALKKHKEKEKKRFKGFFNK